MNGVALVVIDDSGRTVPGALGFILNADRSLHSTYPPANADGFVASLPMPAGPFSGILVLAGAAKYYEQPFSYSVDTSAFTLRVGASKVAPNDIQLPACSPFRSARPSVPTRHALLNGQCTMQGLYIHTEQFGWMPWWPAVWAWLTKADRAYVATQLLGVGEEVIVFQYPDGRPLYDEEGQFYTPKLFSALGPWTMDQAADLVEETIGYGFKGCWIFLGGDDGNNGGFFESQAQVKALGPILTARTLQGYCVVIPGWDGVWHKPNPGTGYSPQQIRQFSLDAKAAGFLYVGIEGGTGYLLCGEGGGDYQPGGAMSSYDLILSEYNDGEFTTGDFWQIMARYLGPAYVMPPDQKQIIANGPSDPLYAQANDPHPIYVLAGLNEQGQPYIHRVFEYGIYGAVRGTPSSVIHEWRQHFIDAGSPNPC